MRKIIMYILKKIKEKVDKQYYFYYTQNNEMLIRQTFPWISLIDSYSYLELYVNWKSFIEIQNITNLITCYYWWEVSLAIAWKDYTKIEKLQSLLDLANNLILFKERLISA